MLGDNQETFCGISYNFCLWFSGKCYNVAEDFFPRRRKPKKETSDEGIPHEEQQRRMQKDFQSEQEKSHFVNIPPHFPHEGKEMLMRDMRNIHLTEEDNNKPLQTEQSDSLSRSLGDNPTEGEKSINNDKEEARDTQSERNLRPELDEHFFYGNVPVLEYQLSDGSGGTVKQTPRRKK